MLRALFALFMISAVPTAYAVMECPNTIVVIACKTHIVTDADGNPVVDQNDKTSSDWTIKNGIFICKREEVQLQDAVVAAYGSDIKTPATDLPPIAELRSNFSDHSQCAHVGMSYGPKWEAENPGWHIWSVGCPVPVVNIRPDGSEEIVGWHLPECPRMLICQQDSAI